MERGYRTILIGIIIVSILIVIANILIYNEYADSLQAVSGRASSGTVTFTNVGGDNNVPNVNIIEPKSQTYDSIRTTLNYTASDVNLANCWYSLDSGATNVTITCGNNITGILSVEGSNTWIVYANDSAGNKNSSSVTFIVSIPVAGAGTGGGGGGGGGGGAVSLPSGAEKNFAVIPEELNVFIIAGKQDEKEIKVINTGSGSLAIKIEVTGITELVGLNTNEISLGPNQEGSVNLTIKAPEYGISAGRIIFSSGNLRRDVFVLINSRSDDALFDASVTIPDGYKVISPGEGLKTFVSLQPVGVPKGVDVTVNYVIKDFDGNILLTESETLFVLESKGFVKEFPSLDLPPGDYIVGIEITYPGGFATSSEHFSVRPRLLVNYWVISTIAFAVLAIGVIIYSAIRLRSYKRNNKHKERGRTK